MVSERAQDAALANNQTMALLKDRMGGVRAAVSARQIAVLFTDRTWASCVIVAAIASRLLSSYSRMTRGEIRASRALKLLSSIP